MAKIEDLYEQMYVGSLDIYVWYFKSYGLEL